MKPSSLYPLTGQPDLVLVDLNTTLEKIQSLLKAKDDTSRFVGLALLKSVLDNGKLVQQPEQVRNLWEALSPSFLDRLLRAHRNEKVAKSEAQDMVDLAIAVLHTFSIILPEESRREKRLVGRVSALLKALMECPPETTKLLLQTLLTITSQLEGALELLRIGDLSPLIEIAARYPLVLDILNFTWTNASTISDEVQSVRESIEKSMTILINVFKTTDAVTLINFTGDLLPKITSEALPQNPKWLKSIVSALRKLVVSKPTLAGRTAYTHLASALLQIYPTDSLNLLFESDAKAKAESKPYSYLFISLILIDIRSSFPSLLAQLNSKEYPDISQRLIAAFDVISSFIQFLVRGLEDDSSEFSLPPDFLLKIRKDIAETMSLTIEYLRDRWDASISGVSGLHPSARSGTAATSEGTHLTLTWESMKDNVNADPLVLASIRALAIWIREDENENLRNETAALMDMLVELYKTSSPETLDFRYPILLALEGIMVADDGIDRFLEQEGWEAVLQDLEAILRTAVNEQVPEDYLKVSEANRGLQIIRVLLVVIDHASTSTPREDWMSAISLTASMKPPSKASASIVLELEIAMLQLSTALLSKSGVGTQKRYAGSSLALSGYARQLGVIVDGMVDKSEAADFKELLEDVALELENLRFAG